MSAVVTQLQDTIRRLSSEERAELMGWLRRDMDFDVESDPLFRREGPARRARAQAEVGRDDGFPMG